MPDRVSKEELERLRRDAAKRARTEVSADILFQTKETNKFLKEGVGFAKVADLQFGRDADPISQRSKFGIDTGLYL